MEELARDQQYIAAEISRELEKLSLCIGYNLEYLAAALLDDENDIERSEIRAALTAARAYIAKIPDLAKHIK